MNKDMEGICGVLDGIYRLALARQPHDPSDYIGDDGLLYCGKCRTPKTCRVQFPTANGALREVLPPVPCKCRQKELEAEEERKRREENAMALQKLQEQSLMDERFRDKTFASYTTTEDNEKILRLSRRYAERFDEMAERNQGLLFYGDVGTGKTFAAACIANELLRKGVPVIMTSFVKLLEDSELAERLHRAKLLIIDDLGAERSSDYALERVYDIVDSRYRAKLPMVLTTNVPLTEIKNAPDIRYRRIYDRILETCYPVEFRGGSFRKTEAKRRFGEMKALLEGV